MSLSRREFLRLSAVVAGAGTLSACAPAYARLADLDGRKGGWPSAPTDVFKQLSRLSYGPTSDMLDAVTESGLRGWVEAQLDPSSIDDRDADLRLRPLDAIGLQANVLADWEPTTVTEQLRSATLLRKVYSKRQLYERMVEFWSDHFNIYLAKGDCWFLKVVDDREVIRKHALGSFRDLLWASAHSPAMLIYLDNQANDKEAPNENYGRELMELHTLGVGSGYTQNDVMQMSRCLTGWSVKRHFWRGDFEFDAARHAGGVKHVLGLRIEPAGQAEAEQVLDVLAGHPATARHISRQLVERFAVDNPAAQAPDLVDRATRTFLATHGDIQAVLRTILYDPRLSGEWADASKLKRPTDFVASALRLLEAETDGGEPLHAQLGAMGQGPFDWPTPDGAPDVLEAWVGNLLPRWSFSLALAENRLSGTQIDLARLVQHSQGQSPAELLSAFSRRLLGQPLQATAIDALSSALRDAHSSNLVDLAMIIVAGLVAAPAFQWR